MPYKSRRQSGRWVTEGIRSIPLPLVSLPSDRFEAEDEIDTPESKEPSSSQPTAIGKALPRSETDIGSLAEIRSPDIRAARRDWKAKTLEGYGGLIDAKLDPDQTEPD
jgi:hypothetical protein